MRKTLLSVFTLGLGCGSLLVKVVCLNRKQPADQKLHEFLQAHGRLPRQVLNSANVLYSSARSKKL